MKYDLLKRPTEITPHLRSVELNAAGDKAFYCYDGQGERVRKVVKKSGGVVEERRYMGGYEVYRKTLTGATILQRTTHNISDGSTTFCRMERRDNAAPVLRYQYANHLGSASLELDAGGLLISYEEYRPFGTTSYRSGRTMTEVSLKRYHYCGKERDEESGLYYYGARFYADWLGRFVSVDPMAGERQWLNPYNYCQNNPVNRVDPDGALDDDPPDNDSPKEEISSDKLDWSIFNTEKQAIVISGVEIVSTSLPELKPEPLFSVEQPDALNVVYSQSLQIPQSEVVVGGGDVASSQGGSNNPIEYFGAANDIALGTAMGYNALNNDIKRKYAYKLSKRTGAKSGKIYQSAKSFGKSSAKVLGKSANVIAVGSIAYDFGTGTANTATLVDAGLLIGGTAAVAIIGTVAAPFVVGAGAVYGVSCLFGFDDYLNETFDISGSINFINNE